MTSGAFDGNQTFYVCFDSILAYTRQAFSRELGPSANSCNFLDIILMVVGKVLESDIDYTNHNDKLTIMLMLDYGISEDLASSIYSNLNILIYNLLRGFIVKGKKYHFESIGNQLKLVVQNTSSKIIPYLEEVGEVIENGGWVSEQTLKLYNDYIGGL